MTDTATGAHAAGRNPADDAGAALTGFRRGAFALYKVLIALYALATLVQIFLAGFGVFGAEGKATDDDLSAELDAHRAIGFLLTHPVALVILILAIVARPGRRIVAITAALFVLGIVQMFLAGGGEDVPFVGGLHALNAVVLLGLAAMATQRAGVGRR